MNFFFEIAVESLLKKLNKILKYFFIYNYYHKLCDKYEKPVNKWSLQNKFHKAKKIKVVLKFLLKETGKSMFKMAILWSSNIVECPN